MPSRVATVFAPLALAALACSGNKSESTSDREVAPEQVATSRAKAAPIGTPTPDAAPPPAPDPLRPRDDLPPDRRVLLFKDGVERIVDVEAARAAGYTIVPLNDPWEPFLFRNWSDGEGGVVKNRYQTIYHRLANDEVDNDGFPLPPAEKNYLEVFGIPPSMTVLRDRFLGDAKKDCFEGIDWARMERIDRIPYRRKSKARRYKRKIDALARKLKRAMKKAKVKDYEALLAKQPKWQDAVDRVLERDLERAVFADIEQRLTCDGHFEKGFGRHKKGLQDDVFRRALRRFQRKQMLYRHPYLRPDTYEVITRPPVETNQLSFVRVLRERVISVAHILEDGTVTIGGTVPTYVGQDGEKKPIRNLLKEFTEAALKQLEVDTPEKTLAFFERHKDDLGWLRGAVAFPKLPEYYSAHMDLSMVIHSGDLWYDEPWNEEGTLRYQKRKIYPKLRIFVRYNGQDIPLVRWPTTIGGWRAELSRNGYEYFKYKGSDWGERVIRKILAGPVWVPPESTPLRSLVKIKRVNGRSRRIVNYDGMGPGYPSAYGLVAGYFVIPGRNGRPDHDRGIRAHGSSNYMSIQSRSGYSHGCHRMLNHQAVRLYTFILTHRRMSIVGDVPLNAHRQFLFKDKVYEMRHPTRGFEYRLDPPLPVRVVKGQIRGDRKEAPEGLVQKPDLVYPEGPPPEMAPAPDEDQPE